MKRSHQPELLGPQPLDGQRVRHLQASRDARSVAYLTEGTADDAGPSHIVWDGRVIATLDGRQADDALFDLSPDGKALVIVRDRHYGGTVELVGGPTWDHGLTVIHYSGWLDNERFAYEGWTQGDDGRIDDAGIRSFVNGEDVTGRIAFHGITDGRRSGLRVQEGRKLYTVWDDGTKSEVVEIPEGYVDDDRLMGVSRYGQRYANEEGSPHIARSPRGEHLCYGDFTHLRAYPEVVGSSGARLQQNESGTISFVAVRYPEWSVRLGRLAGRLMEKADAHRTKHGKEPFWALPFAYAFSPYMPFLHPLMKGSARSHPVRARRYADGTPEEHEWKKGYRFVREQFLTSGGEVVAVVADRRGFRVVVDEVEGQEYDEVWCVRELDDGRVVYAASSRDKLIRVIVQ